jgi:hypothetical protein
MPTYAEGRCSEPSGYKTKRSARPVPFGEVVVVGPGAIRLEVVAFGRRRPSVDLDAALHP